MLNVLKWFLVGVSFLILSACGGGGGGGTPDKHKPQVDNTVLEFQNKKDTVVLDNNNSKDIVDKTVDESNASIKIIKLDKTLAKSVTDKKIITILPNSRFPLGYTAKILGTSKNADGTVNVKTTNLDLKDIKKLEVPKTNMEIKKMHFVGIISPFVKRDNNSSRRSKVIKEKDFNIHYDGESINLSAEGKESFEYPLDKNLTLEIGGKISNISIDSKGKFIIQTKILDGKLVDVDFAEDFKLSYDQEFWLALKGEWKGNLGHFDKEWEDMEKYSFEDYGINISGLKADDKKGKIPVAGLIFNGALTGGVNIDTAFAEAKAGGIILWIYIDMNGKLNLEGSIGLSNNAHHKITVKKELKDKVPSLKHIITAIEGKNYLEAPYIDGKAELTLTKGLSLEADFVVGGLRILNLSGEAKIEFTEKAYTKDRIGYVLKKPNSSWKWDGGTVCLDGSFGVGAIAKANFILGLQYKDKLSYNKSFAFQYPSQENIDKAKQGWVGTWYKVPVNHNCYNVPTPSDLNEAHIKNIRKAIDDSKLKEVADENYKYAYLANRIYRDTLSDKNKVEHNWKLIEYEYNSKNGFKAGLYENAKTNEKIIAYGGTTANGNGKIGVYDSIVDLATDISLLSVYSFNQPSEALSFYNKYKGGGVTGITGHSLGGGLAQYAGLYSGIKTVTFNTAPLPFNMITSALDFKNVISLSGDTIKSVTFDNQDKITNIMTPYDPISTISTAVMSVDESSAGYLMAARFMMGIPLNQKLDYLITGKKIYIPLINLGGVLNFANHSMDNIEKTFISNTNYKADYNTTSSNGSISIDNLTVKDKDNQQLGISDISYTYYEIYNGDTLIKEGELNGEITDLPSDTLLKVKIHIILNDGRELIKETTIQNTTANTPPIANAGADKTIKVGESVTLDASGSSDAEDEADALTYTWTWKSEEDNSTLEKEAKSFEVAGLSVGEHIFTLTVTDTNGASSSDDVKITATMSKQRTVRFQSKNTYKIFDDGRTDLQEYISFQKEYDNLMFIGTDNGKLIVLDSETLEEKSKVIIDVDEFKYIDAKVDYIYRNDNDIYVSLNVMPSRLDGYSADMYIAHYKLKDAKIDSNFMELFKLRSNPNDGRANGGPITGMYVYGNYLYVTSGGNLASYDLSKNPVKEKNFFWVYGGVKNLCGIGNNIYVYGNPSANHYAISKYNISEGNYTYVSSVDTSSLSDYDYRNQYLTCSMNKLFTAYGIFDETLNLLVGTDNDSYWSINKNEAYTIDYKYDSNSNSCNLKGWKVNLTNNKKSKIEINIDSDVNSYENCKNSNLINAHLKYNSKYISTLYDYYGEESVYSKTLDLLNQYKNNGYIRNISKNSNGIYIGTSLKIIKIINNNTYKVIATNNILNQNGLVFSSFDIKDDYLLATTSYMSNGKNIFLFNLNDDNVELLYSGVSYYGGRKGKLCKDAILVDGTSYSSSSAFDVLRIYNYNLEQQSSTSRYFGSSNFTCDNNSMYYMSYSSYYAHVNTGINKIVYNFENKRWEDKSIFSLGGRFKPLYHNSDNKISFIYLGGAYTNENKTSFTINTIDDTNNTLVYGNDFPFKQENDEFIIYREDGSIIKRIKSYCKPNYSIDSIIVNKKKIWVKSNKGVCMFTLEP